MAQKDLRRSWVMINRAAVLTLWAAVVAEVLGFEHDEALTLGRAVAGLNAYSKGVSLGLFQPTPREVKELAEKPTPCTRNLGRRFLRVRKDGGPPANWTWTSSVKWVLPDPEGLLFNFPDLYLIKKTESSESMV